MPRYYCDYCDTYLTHDSPSVRKQHNAGYKHKANVRTYYQQFEEQQTQSLIDQRIKEHLGQAAAFQQQIGATYNHHLVSLPGNPPRPRLPILPPNMMPIGSQPPLNSTNPGIRPPVLPLPRPLPGTPGYGIFPTVPPLAVPPGTSTFQMPPVIAPPAPGDPNPIVGSSTTPTSNSTLDIYQPNPPAAESTNHTSAS